jgi:sugar-specific transcriptional regulator TrmB
MFIEELINAGLKEKEALIYNTLLSSGNLPVNEIIKKTNLKRGIVYKSLYDLIEKGLVSEDSTKKKLFFKPEHPFKLSEIVEQKYKEALKNQNTLSTILPQLVSSFKSAGNKPGIKTYEGIEGIKEVFLDIINTKQKIYSIRQTSDLFPGLYDWFQNVYKPLRRENKIWTNIILTQETSYATDYLLKEPEKYREIRYIKDSVLPEGIEMNIYGDKVAFINFNKNSDLFAIVIQNPLIINTQKALFELAWETAGVYAKSMQEKKDSQSSEGFLK